MEKNKWQKHQWYNANDGSRISEETKELDVTDYNRELQAETAKFLVKLEFATTV